MSEEAIIKELKAIKEEVSSVQTDTGSIYSYVSDISDTNQKLDKIIELLEHIIRNK